MWLNPQFLADLVEFAEEILNGKLHFLCNVFASFYRIYTNTIFNEFIQMQIYFLYKNSCYQIFILSESMLSKQQPSIWLCFTGDTKAQLLLE